MGYMGSEEFIRLQFEEYLLSLISSVKYHVHLKENGTDPKLLITEIGEYAGDLKNPSFGRSGINR